MTKTQRQRDLLEAQCNMCAQLRFSAVDKAYPLLTAFCSQINKIFYQKLRCAVLRRMHHNLDGSN